MSTRPTETPPGSEPCATVPGATVPDAALPDTAVPAARGRGRTGPFSRRHLRSTLLGGYLPMLIAALLIVLPLVWMLLATFKHLDELTHIPLQWLPSRLYLGNYVEALQRVPFARNFANSVIITVIGAGTKLALSILTAYGLVFCRFPGKRIIFLAILVTLMVPAQIAIVPNYILISAMGGLNTYWGILLPGLATAFGTFLLRQQFLSFPLSVIEAAQLDGAGHWRRLWRIVAPMSVPSIVTLALVFVVFDWNDYLWPLIVVDDPNMMTLPVGLTFLKNSDHGPTSWGVVMAGVLIVVVPILIVFALLQRHIVAGFTQGAVKG